MQIALDTQSEQHAAGESDAPSASDDPLPRSSDEPEPARGDSSLSAGVVVVIDDDGYLDANSADWLCGRAQAALEALDAPGEVRVRLVGDDEMADAHVRHMNVGGTTDVITFNLNDVESPDATLDVDLLVCVDEARRQSNELGIKLVRELLLYVVHGVLHCQGYRDDDEASFKAMHSREDEILDKIGVGATYALGARRGRK